MRGLVVALLHLVVAVALLSFGCDANLTNNCVAGPCSDDAGVKDPGAGGAAPEPPCITFCKDNQPPKTGNIPCEVWAVMHRDPIDNGGCHTCHQDPPQNNAPFKLTRYADLQEQFGITDLRKYQRMCQVIQPDSLPHMPFGDAPQLSAADFKTLNDWLNDCAPPAPEGEGDEACCDMLGLPSNPEAGCP